MKLAFKLFLLMTLLWFCIAAAVGFRRSSDHKVFQYITDPLPSDVYVIGRMSPDTNYNFPHSNIMRLMTNVATYLITSNGISASIATNIAAYQTLIGTNNLWLATSNALFAATNNFAPTNTGVAGQVLHTTGSGLPTKWDYVNQALTNSNPRVPDFNLPVNYWVTNLPFLFLAPANVDTTGKKLQVTDVFVTNTTAAAVAVTFTGAIHVTGTAFVTNLSVFHFRQFAGLWTNCACEPVW